MGWFEAVVLGLVQGLTEFLPISSSGHLRVTAALAGWPDPGAAFTAVTQLGTEAAVLLYFRREIVNIIGAWAASLVKPERRRDPDARMGWFVILGTLPIGVLGFTFQDTIEGALRDLRVTAVTLIVFGLILAAADHVGSNRRTLSDLNMPHALGYGFAQALALIPGVSRSGGTITAGLLLGYRREAAARYSFLLAIPAVLASGGLELTKIGEGAAPAWGPTLLATVVSFFVGFAVIVWFLRYVSTHKFTAFVVYRVLAGLAIFALIWAGVLDPNAGSVGS
ncbi:undecaprenyl-diphosphate phosphatase [Salinifilum ghardaiensis]